MNIPLLKAKLKEKNKSALIFSEVNRKYFTSFPSSDGWLLVNGEKAVFLTDSRYVEAAQNQCEECDEVLLYKNFKDSVLPVMEKMGRDTFAIESAGMTLSIYNRLTEQTGAGFDTTALLDDMIASIRMVKSDAEAEKIIKAQRIAEQGLDHILGFIKPGMTEKEVQLELDYYMLSHGAEALSFETIAVAGAKTSMPHGVPGENVIRNGDFVTMDFGAVYEGYHSDMTRTVAVGFATDEMKKVYETVKEAQKAAFEKMAPGITGKEVDAAGRKVITDAGYGEYFGHGLGHGVGVEIHEEPYVSPNGNKPLAPGNVITNEPGIYLPGKFGVRIEDMALITEDGYKNLTAAQKELVIL